MVFHNTILNPEHIYLKSNEYTTLHNGSNKSYVSFELKNSIRVPNNVDAYVQLNSFKFTNSFYNINTLNNIFYYSLSSNINTILTVNIPVGQYTITTLLNYINTSLNGSIVLAYSNTTFKITFSSSSYTFIIRSGTNDCLSVLGLTGTTTQSNNTTSTKLINLSGVQVVYLSLPNIKLYSNSAKNSKTSNILESINVDVLIGSSQSYYNPTNTRYKIGDDTINFIEVKLFDEYNNLLDFNNTDWFLNISIIFVYKFEYIPPQLLDLNNTDKQTENINNIDITEEK